MLVGEYIAILLPSLKNKYVLQYSHGDEYIHCMYFKTILYSNTFDIVFTPIYFSVTLQQMKKSLSPMTYV